MPYGSKKYHSLLLGSRRAKKMCRCVLGPPAPFLPPGPVLPHQASCCPRVTVWFGVTGIVCALVPQCTGSGLRGGFCGHPVAFRCVMYSVRSGSPSVGTVLDHAALQSFVAPLRRCM